MTMTGALSNIGGTVSTTLTAAQIAGYAQSAGFSVLPGSAAPALTGSSVIPIAAPSPVVIITAICLAESGGNTLATHHNTNGTTDYGLAQINSVHADLLAKYTWTDPQQNLEMAFNLYQAAGAKFTPWSTYTSGAYLLHMNEAQTGANNTSQQGTVQTIVGGNIPGVSALDSLSTFLTDLTKKGTWISVGLILLGAILLVVVLIKMVASNKTVQKVGATVAKAAVL